MASKMFLNKTILFLLFLKFNKLLSGIVDLRNVQQKDLDRLKQQYPMIAKLTLNFHEYYANDKKEPMICPIPWIDTSISDEVLLYGDMKVIGKKLSEVLHTSFNTEKKV